MNFPDAADGAFRDDPVHQAILASSPSNVVDTRAYREAVQKCPQVVQRESPHSRFLQFCNNDLQSAAKRLTNYWNSRLQVFGPVLTFGPLAQALGEHDKKVLQRGYGVVLPDSDRHGRPALLLDLARLDKQASASSVGRVMWFLLQKLVDESCDDSSLIGSRATMEALFLVRAQGCVSYGKGSMELDLFELSGMLLSEAFCVHIAQFHVADVKAARRPGIATLNDRQQLLIPDEFAALTRIFDESSPITLHRGLTIRKSLTRSHDFVMDNLPDSLGGVWSYDREWASYCTSQWMTVPMETEDPGLEQMLLAETVNLTDTARSSVINMKFDDDKKALQHIDMMQHPQPQSPGGAFQDNLVHEAMVFVANKSAYMHAAECCPEVVRSESPHERFLHFCGNNMWEAASRLAAYWELRLEVFGQADAYRPLWESLTKEDWEDLAARHRAILPQDARGRPVYFVDRVAQTVNFSRAEKLKARLRGVFVIMQLLCDEARSSNGQIVCIFRLNNTTLSLLRNDRELITLMRRGMTEAFPGRFQEVHYASVDPPSGGSLGLTVLLGAIKRASKWLFSIPSHFHSGFAKEVMISLEAHGLHSNVVPSACGGRWSKWETWLQECVGLKAQNQSQLSAQPAVAAARDLLAFQTTENGAGRMGGLVANSHALAGSSKGSDHIQSDSSSTGWPDMGSNELPASAMIQNAFATNAPVKVETVPAPSSAVTAMSSVLSSATMTSFAAVDQCSVTEQKGPFPAASNVASRGSTTINLGTAKASPPRFGEPLGTAVGHVQPDLKQPPVIPSFAATASASFVPQSSQSMSPVMAKAPVKAVSAEKASRAESMTNSRKRYTMGMSQSVEHVIEARKKARRQAQIGYNRRSRAVAKANEIAVRNQAASLKAENAQLLAENARLHQLITSATSLVRERCGSAI